MADNYSLAIKFTTNDDEFLSALAYIIKKANTNHYYNPQLTSGELFDIFEVLVTEYKSMHPDNTPLSVAEYMELFYKSETLIDVELKDSIEELFEDHKSISRDMKQMNGNVTFSIDAEPSTLTFLFPEGIDIDYNELRKNKQNGSSNISDGLTEELENTVSDVYHGADSAQLSPVDMLRFFTAISDLDALTNPDMYFDIETKLHGSTMVDKFEVSSILVSAIDVLLYHYDSPMDIDAITLSRFIYNVDGDSLEILDNYILYSGRLEKYKDSVKILHKYFTRINVHEYSLDISPLTQKEQYLLLTIDKINRAFIKMEGDY